MMGRMAEFDADVKRFTRTLEALGEDSLRATPRGSKALQWCRKWLQHAQQPIFATAEAQAIAAAEHSAQVRKAILKRGKS